MAKVIIPHSVWVSELTYQISNIFNERWPSTVSYRYMSKQVNETFKRTDNYRISPMTVLANCVRQVYFKAVFRKNIVINLFAQSQERWLSIIASNLSCTQLSYIFILFIIYAEEDDKILIKLREWVSLRDCPIFMAVRDREILFSRIK